MFISSFLSHAEKYYINNIIINYQVFNNFKITENIFLYKFKQYSIILASNFEPKGTKKPSQLTRRHTASSTGHVALAVRVNYNFLCSGRDIGLNSLYCGKWTNISKSCRDLDLDLDAQC